jgi:hypothetical protein
MGYVPPFGHPDYNPSDWEPTVTPPLIEPYKPGDWGPNPFTPSAPRKPTPTPTPRNPADLRPGYKPGDYLPPGRVPRTITNPHGVPGWDGFDPLKWGNPWEPGTGPFGGGYNPQAQDQPVGATWDDIWRKFNPFDPETPGEARKRRLGTRDRWGPWGPIGTGYGGVNPHSKRTDKHNPANQEGGGGETANATGGGGNPSLTPQRDFLRQLRDPFWKQKREREWERLKPDYQDNPNKFSPKPWWADAPQQDTPMAGTWGDGTAAFNARNRGAQGAGGTINHLANKASQRVAVQKKKAPTPTRKAGSGLKNIRLNAGRNTGTGRRPI